MMPDPWPPLPQETPRGIAWEELLDTVPSGTDTDAIHDGTAGEIAAVTEKATPVSADLLLIEDSAAANVKKRVQVGNLPTGDDANAIHDDEVGEIHAVTVKGTPVGADELLIEDSAASWAKKRVTITSLPTGVVNLDKLKIAKTSDQEIINTAADISFQSEVTDTDGWFDSGTSVYDIQVSTSGLYLATIQFEWDVEIETAGGLKNHTDGTWTELRNYPKSSTAQDYEGVLTALVNLLSTKVYRVNFHPVGGTRDMMTGTSFQLVGPL